MISAATLAARRRGARVLGIVQGFQWLMEGDIDHVIDLDENAVNRISELGGSILRTSRENPTTSEERLDTVVRTLRPGGKLVVWLYGHEGNEAWVRFSSARAASVPCAPPAQPARVCPIRA